jgi:D-arabinose 1-dehydrogenase-like Zn-dependent alcohol dehydrogenase
MNTSLLERTAARQSATETMRAVVVHSFDEPAQVEDLPKPVAGPGEIVVKIEASGLCHTDIHAAHGDWPVKPKLPFTPGHEGVGIVETIGAGGHRGCRGRPRRDPLARLGVRNL